MPLSESSLYQSLVDAPFISRTRRNHGLEHATLHVLAERYPGKSMGGHSDAQGFWLVGDLPTEAVESAVGEALTRLQNGEANLAIHPNCGTNFATSGTLAGIAGAAAMIGVGPRKRDKLDRFALAASLATLALMVGQPLGKYVQRHVTTSGRPEGLRVLQVFPKQRGRMKAHRVITEG